MAHRFPNRRLWVCWPSASGHCSSIAGAVRSEEPVALASLHPQTQFVHGLGSTNLNHLSLRVSQEQNVATSDPGFSARLKRELFEEDFHCSYELTEPVSIEWVDFLADLLLEGV